MHPRNACLVSSERASCISGMCVSVLLNMHKKRISTDYSLGILLAPTCSMPIGTHIRTYVCQWACGGPMQEAPRGAQAV
jgi:hypothetical protein